MAQAGSAAHSHRVRTLRRVSTAAISGCAATALVVGLAPSSAQATGVVTTFIVTYAAPPSASQVDVLKGVSDSVHGFVAVPAAVVVAPSSLARLLRALPGVRGVYADEAYEYSSGNAATAASKASRVWTELGWEGDGVGIAIIDAGVDGAHPDLCAAAVFCKGTPIKTIQNVKVVGNQDVADPVVYLENQISTDSTSGHGSHVAGIAAGNGAAGADPTRYRGVAPGANLIGYGTGEVISATNVLGAFDHAISHRDQYAIKAINNSWGPGAFTPYDPDHPVNLAIDSAWAAGISVIFGAGNDGTRTGSLNMFSANPHAISAGGGRKDGQQAFFSSKGVPGHPQLHPTLTAPGELIASVRATTGFTMAAADAGNAGGADPDTPTGADTAYYATSSGTSMASPHIAGVIALMQEAAHTSLGRWLTPVEVRNILQNTATAMPGYQQYSVGAGYVNALAATQAATTATQTQDYVSPVITDVAPFAGTVGGAFVSTASFSGTYDVAPGARSLDVMVDWGIEKVLAANTDVDIDLVRPDGSGFLGTFLRCDANAQPNGYSSFCTSAPNERLSVVDPAPGRWTVNVHAGLASVNENVRGLWSATYPSGTAISPHNAPAAMTLEGAPALALAGQPASLVATVRDNSGLPLPNVPVSWTTTGVGGLSHIFAVTDDYGRARAQADSAAPGTQQVSATAGAITKAVSLSWLGVTVPSLPTLPCVLNCPAPIVDSNGKASVGGWWSVGGVKHRLAATAEHTAGASTTTGELTYDDKSGSKVEGTGVEHLVINGNVATITGTAIVNGATGYRYSLTITDNGEPGSSDKVQLTVTKPGSSYRLEDGGTLAAGNAQVQPA